MKMSRCIEVPIIIIVPTKELYRKVVIKAIKEGCKWRDGDKDINPYYWDCEGKDTIIYTDKNRLLTYGSFKQKKDYDGYIFLTAEMYLGGNIL